MEVRRPVLEGKRGGGMERVGCRASARIYYLPKPLRGDSASGNATDTSITAVVYGAKSLNDSITKMDYGNH
ncbi:hypothetical protein E2C01_082630 [Portunus trituberculatus]|uniref:Uncharacterized protein n=1 Tax=Portunus trituberculatus TaxID=210409 RepID=A0A5B7J1C6_PORTR|nr:hypothetical protein [Portunus trituberculatus]